MREKLKESEGRVRGMREKEEKDEERDRREGASVDGMRPLLFFLFFFVFHKK